MFKMHKKSGRDQPPAFGNSRCMKEINEYAIRAFFAMLPKRYQVPVVPVSLAT
jgi:hypothetical protein